MEQIFGCGMVFRAETFADVITDDVHVYLKLK